MKKKRLALILLLAVTPGAFATEYHVAPTGNDRNPGAEDQPFATVTAARDALRACGQLSKAPCAVVIHAGTYRFTDPLVLNPQDGGAKGAEVIYRSVKGETVVFTGAEKLELDWEPWRAGIFRARLEHSKSMDQLFVDGVRQHMARYPNYEASNINSISQDKTQHRTIPYNGCAADAWSAKKAKEWADPVNAYMHAMHKGLWGGIQYRVTGKNADGGLAFEGGLQNNRMKSMDMGSVHREFRMIENVFEELDAPGEWYFARRDGWLYYKPPPV